MITDQALAQYPQTWDDFVGQEQAKRQLRVATESARQRGDRLSHVLLASGVAGIGKTALALLTAVEAGVHLHSVSGKMSLNEARIALSRLDHRDILFIDEAHRLVNGGKKNAEWLLHLLQDGVLMGPKGPEQQPDVTVIAATTDAGRLPKTIIGRFPLRPVLKPYTLEEATRIAMRMAGRILPEDVPFPETYEFMEIAQAGNRNPRTISQIITNLRDLAVADLDAVHDGGYNLAEPLAWLGLREDGLSENACRYLTVLMEDFSGQAGERALQERLNEPGGLDHIESELMERGLIARTQQGRVLTKEGIERANEFSEEVHA